MTGSYDMRKIMIPLEVFKHRKAPWDWVLLVKVSCECGAIFEEELTLRGSDLICSKCFAMASGKGIMHAHPCLYNLVKHYNIKIPALDSYIDKEYYWKENLEHKGLKLKKPIADHAFKNNHMIRPGRFGSWPGYRE